MIFARIESQGYITNRDFVEMRVSHIGRNRLTEEKGRAYFAAKGFRVVYHHAPEFLDHKWVLERIETPPYYDKGGQAQMGLGV
jgi:hypothetical protein